MNNSGSRSGKQNYTAHNFLAAIYLASTIIWLN